MKYRSIEDIFDGIGIEYVRQKPMSQLTTFRIGGPAELAVYPANEDQLIFTVKALKEHGVRYLPLGMGSNAVFGDGVFDGAVILTSRISDIACDGETVTASAGAHLSKVCNAALSEGLTGLEFAYGIPGSLGGAVFMNAGAYGGEMKDVIVSVRYYDTETDKIESLPSSECAFGHRTSIFQSGRYIILSAEMKLAKGDKESIRAKMDELMARRKDKQPLEYPSAGSAFKRYPGRYTGQMIEAAGLKGFSVGGAEVSQKHAGFIINKGNATAEDVRLLTEHIKRVIYEREGVMIECEIRFIN